MNCYELTLGLIREAEKQHQLSVNEARAVELEKICDLIIGVAEESDAKGVDADVVFDSNDNALLVLSFESVDMIVERKDSPMYQAASAVNSIRFVQENKDFLKVEFVISDLFSKT